MTSPTQPSLHLQSSSAHCLDALRLLARDGASATLCVGSLASNSLQLHEAESSCPLSNRWYVAQAAHCLKSQQHALVRADLMHCLCACCLRRARQPASTAVVARSATAAPHRLACASQQIVLQATYLLVRSVRFLSAKAVAHSLRRRLPLLALPALLRLLLPPTSRTAAARLRLPSHVFCIRCKRSFACSDCCCCCLPRRFR